MKNLSQKQSDAVKKDTPGRDFILFVLGLACFTFILGTAAHLYDSKHPRVFPVGIVTNCESSVIEETKEEPTFLALGWPGPIIDVHIERPISMPQPDGVGPNHDLY